MIEVANLSKTYPLSRQQKKESGSQFSGDTLEALKGISFQCRPGRVTALLGPNGAGKTTALRIIATMLQPTEGTVTVNGIDVTENPSAVCENIGFLTGSTGLYDRLTANELVRYYADLHGVPRADFEKRRDRLFDLLDVHTFADQRIGTFSTGMRQKVSIVRSIIHDPDVIVFDEATAGLDVIAARNIVRLVRQSRDDGKTVLFSTHRMDEVNLLADDLGLLHEGRLLYDGTYAEFEREARAATLEEEFIRRIEAADERPDRTASSLETSVPHA